MKGIFMNTGWLMSEPDHKWTQKGLEGVSRDSQFRNVDGGH
jgi:hypothetical protein